MPAIQSMDVNKHIREGDEALPQAVLQQANEAERRAEVVETTFTGDEDSKDDSL